MAEANDRDENERLKAENAELHGLRAVDASVIRHWEEADTKSAIEIERLETENARHMREKVALAGLVAKERDEIARLQSLADSMGQDNIDLVKRCESLQEIVLVKSREILALLEIIQRQIGLDCNKE